MSGATCERKDNYFNETVGHPPQVHVVYQLFFNHVGEGTLHIEELCHSQFASSPGILDFVGHQQYCISGVSPRPAAKLGRWEEVVLLSKVQDVLGA